MANEATQIPNPSTFVGLESEGYGRQNTKIAAGFVGIDTTAPYVNVDGNIVIPIGGIVEVNGVLYKIETESILTPLNGVKNYIKLVVGTTGLTPTVTSDSGTFSAMKYNPIESGLHVPAWLEGRKFKNSYGFKEGIQLPQPALLMCLENSATVNIK